MTVSQGLSLAVNGQKYTVPSSLDPTTSLNEFLKTCTPYKAAKLGCSEGGCGACAVEVESLDPATGKTYVRSINSCLAPIASLDGAAVTTSEGLGNAEDGYHPIQERIAGFHASQCGFCTPGMVVACHSALARAKDKGEEPTPEYMEKAIDGNLCRCTGYRSILSACKSFSGADIEDLGLAVFPEGMPTEGGKEPVFPESMKEYKGVTGPTEMGGRVWAAPTSLAELFTVLDDCKANGDSAKLMAGNTGVGVYKNPPTEKVLISTLRVKELRAVEASKEGGLVLGAATTITELIDLLRVTCPDKDAPYQQIANHLDRLAGTHVRSAATLGGNLVLTKTLALPSDLVPLLVAVNGTVTLTSKAGTKEYSVEEFLAADIDLSSHVVTTITVPASKPGDVFWSNRIAARYSNAVASINTALLLNLEGSTVASACVVFGHADETPDSWIIYRAETVEAALTGKPASFETLVAALEAAPADVNGDGYLQSSAEGLLMQALAPLVDEAAEGVALKGLLAAKKFEAPGTVSAHQDFPPPRKEMAPVGMPVQKDRVRLQASGEAIYTSDVNLPNGGVFAKYVLATEPLAEFTVDATAALALPGVVDFVSVADVPAKGNNEYGGEVIFADKKVEFAGQAIGLILAESQFAAEAAAAAVKVSYKAAGKPVFNIAQAKEADSFYDLSVYGPMGVTESHTGDVPGALAAAKHRVSGGYKTPSQYHFYMEPQCAVAIPDEGETMTVWASTQGVDFTQDGVAKVLGLPFHKINAICRRAGGGFGGKSFRSIPFAAAAAVAAAKTKRAVRLVVSRKDDMCMVGGRAEMEASFEVGFDDDGKISALDLKTFMQAGAFIDIAQFLPYLYNSTIDQAYHIPNIALCTKLCRTNVQPRTIMRAPGTMQALFTIEAVIEHVAGALGLDPMAVREANLLKGAAAPPRYKKPCAGEPSFAVEEGATEEEEEDDEAIVKTTFGTEVPAGFYTVPRLWSSLKDKADFEARSAAVRAFNAESKWRKRGISMLAGRFEMQVDAKPAGVHLYHDGTVLVVSPGHEMGQGLLTKVKQAACFELSKLLPEGELLPLDLFHIADNSTHSLPNTGPSWGSTTSESSCEAVRIACESMRKTLAPHFAELGESATWFDVLKKVHPMPGMSASKVLLSSYTYYDGTQRSGPPKPLHYAGYGVGCSEVEIDVLTGDRRVLRSDVMLDAAFSLNPGIDLGQVEGGYVQGLGMVLNEALQHDLESGKLLTDGTWTYKIPSASDVPREMNAYLLKDSPNPRCILSSKAVGEPPCLISVSVLTALQMAATAAKEELTGKKERVFLNVPVTPKKLKAALGLDTMRLASVLRAGA